MGSWCSQSTQTWHLKNSTSTMCFHKQALCAIHRPDWKKTVHRKVWGLLDKGNWENYVCNCVCLVGGLQMFGSSCKINGDTCKTTSGRQEMDWKRQSFLSLTRVQLHIPPILPGTTWPQLQLALCPSRCLLGILCSFFEVRKSLHWHSGCLLRPLQDLTEKRVIFRVGI